MQGFIAKAKPHTPEAALLVAFALIAYGVSLLCYPAGFIVGGILLAFIVFDNLNVFDARR